MTDEIRNSTTGTPAADADAGAVAAHAPDGASSGGMSRRDMLRRTALAGGALVVASGSVQTIARPAFANTPIGELFSNFGVLLDVDGEGGLYRAKWDGDEVDDGGAGTLSNCDDSEFDWGSANQNVQNVLDDADSLTDVVDAYPNADSVEFRVEGDFCDSNGGVAIEKAAASDGNLCGVGVTCIVVGQGQTKYLHPDGSVNGDDNGAIFRLSLDTNGCVATAESLNGCE